jgi:hypothetical protein
LKGGELLTKPLKFTGRELEINFATSAAGSIRVEMQNEAGQPLPGFALADSQSLFGDSLARKVSWAKGTDVSEVAGKTVRLRFVMQDADLYALRFTP